MITFDHVSFVYPESNQPTLRAIDLEIEEGEMALVVGPTGSGKSTLLGTVNGLVPHFTGGTLAGRVLVAGRDTATHRPRELADVVGVVGQDPLAGFVTDTVEEELAYGMEQLAVAPAVMRKRVEETLDLLSIADLRDRALADLSGGQCQRVAIAAVLAAGPRVLVLDEPTSALDPTAAEEVLAALTRLVHDLGVTVLLAEHRLERVIGYADRLIEIGAGGTVRHGRPAEMLPVLSMPPPVVELGRLASWTPLPDTVRTARRLAGPLRRELEGRPTPPRPHVVDRCPGPEALRAKGIVVRYGPLVAIGGVDISFAAGQVTALMGRNGSGKSSLLWALQGSGRRQGGTVSVCGRDPSAVGAPEARRLVGLVPQSPGDLLYLTTVAAECERADREAGAPAGSTASLLERLAPGVAPDTHPRDLSEGQRLALVVAIQLSAGPPVLLLDEPTRGLDARAKRALREIVDALAGEGRAVVVATHDVEFVAAAADRVVVLAAGEVVADGPTEEVIGASPAFAPQVAKVLAPLPYLTVEQVALSLEALP